MEEAAAVWIRDDDEGWLPGVVKKVEPFGSASGESYKKIIIVGCGELRADGSEFRVLS